MQENTKIVKEESMETCSDRWRRDRYDLSPTHERALCCTCQVMSNFQVLEHLQCIHFYRHILCALLLLQSHNQSTFLDVLRYPFELLASISFSH